MPLRRVFRRELTETEAILRRSTLARPAHVPSASYVQLPSALEHIPAVFIPQPLVVQHKRPYFGGKVGTLPLAFQPPSFQPFRCRGRCSHRPDRVGRCTQFMGGHMGHHARLSSRESRFPCRALQLAGSAHRVTASDSRLSHREITSSPGACRLDRPARTVIIGLRLLEPRQDVLRAVRRPHGQQAMIGVLQGSAAPQCDQPGGLGPCRKS